MENKHRYPTINYIGNKEKIADWICEQIPDDAKSFFDAFSGGCSVGYRAKDRGLFVYTNDVMKVNYQISKGLIENRSEILEVKDVDLLFSGDPIRGFMYKNYADVFYYADECMALDQYIHNVELLESEYKRALALIMLRRAMIRKMPYSRFTIPWHTIKLLRDEQYSYQKYKRKRAYHNQSFQYHVLESLDEYNQSVFDNGSECKAYNEDIFKIIPDIDADVIYLDPPYAGTMNDYFGFYGVIDECICGSKLDPFENNFVSKKNVVNLLDRLFSNLGKYKYWMLSYNNASYPAKDEMITLLEKYASNIKVLERPHVYKITGKERKKDNTEYLFIVKPK